MDKEKIKLAQFNQEQLDDLYLSCCHKGDLEAIKYMLTSPELHRRPDFEAVDKFDGHDGLTYAAIGGHLNIIEYLLYSQELEKHDFFPLDHFDYLKEICKAKQFHVADFLLDKGFFDPLIVFKKTLFHGRRLDDLCEYLVIKCDIPITPEVQKVINGTPFVAELFAKRELNKELNNTLTQKDIPEKKFKL